MATAFFFNRSGAGHINPSLGLVHELVRRGETIDYFAREAYRARIEGAGARFRRLDVEPVEHQVEDSVHLALTLLQEALALLPTMLERVGREQPDYLLFDAMCPLGWLLARITGLPAIASCSTFAFTPDVLRALLPPSQLEQLLGGGGSPHLERYERVAAEASDTYQVAVPGWFSMLNGLFGDRTLLYTSPAMHPAAASLDGSFRFVGTCLRPAEKVPDFPYAVLKASDLIYISLGTEFNDNLGFYRDCIAAFGDAPHRVLLSVGQRVDLAALGAVPEHIVVCRSVPQLEVLPHTRLFVTHGGANSVHEALYFGVPLIVVPQMREQEANARQVAAVGAGIFLDRAEITPARVRDSVDAVLASPGFARNAERIGATLRQAGGAKQAAEEVLSWRNQIARDTDRFDVTISMEQSMTPSTIDPAVRIGHVHLRVADLDRALRFYRDMLGFTVTGDARSIGLQAVFLAAGDYHHHLALNTWLSAGGTPPPTGHTGLHHVAFVYPDRQALARAVQRLRSHDYPIDSAEDHGATVSVYLCDPDGNGVELYYDRPREAWFDADGRPIIKAEPFAVDELLESGIMVS